MPGRSKAPLQHEQRTSSSERLSERTVKCTSPNSMVTKKGKRQAPPPSPRWKTRRLCFGTLDSLSAALTRPLVIVALIALASWQGHYLPLLWSSSDQPALVPSLLPPRRSLLPPLHSLLPPRSFLKVSGLARLSKRVNEAESAEEESGSTHPRPGAELEAALSSVPDHPREADVSPRVNGATADVIRETAGDEAGVVGRSHQEASKASTSGSSAYGGGEQRDASVSAVQSEVTSGEDAEEGSEDSSSEESADKDWSSPQLDDRNDAAGPTEGDEITPYVSFHRIKIAAQPACRSVVPLKLLQSANRSPIGDLKTLDEPNRRALVFMARFGLGNSLRGFVSAYVYARVSGRTLVRFHGAEHTKVYDSLCLAFRCGFDSIHWDNTTGPMPLFRALEALNPFPMYKASRGIRGSIKEDVPVIVSRSPSHFDGFWRIYPSVLDCVYASFACSSVWCVHSRAIHGLLLGPTPLLKDMIRQILRKHVPPEHDAKGDGKDIAAAEETDSAGRKGRVKGLDGMFDVALHLRTRTAAIESKEGGDGELSRVGCTEARESKTKAKHQFLKACLWDCLGGILERIDKNRQQIWAKSRGKQGSPPRLSILLTTDNEALRPIFVRRLSLLGDVYFSAGAIVHLSKSAGSDAERLPTMAEFFLMARSHTIIEAGSYISTFAYFAGLYGNGTLASIDWFERGGCGLKLSHKGEIASPTSK